MGFIIWHIIVGIVGVLLLCSVFSGSGLTSDEAYELRLPVVSERDQSDVVGMACGIGMIVYAIWPLL